MKSGKPGKRTSVVKVSRRTPEGFWLAIGAQEDFVPFDRFPWFRSASIDDLRKVELEGPNHLRWPELDVDLAVESLSHPEHFPLVSKHGAAK